MSQEPNYLEGDYYGQYRWLERHDHRTFLAQLVAHCPAALIGRRMVITALDSGPADIAVNADWRFENRLLISPELDRQQIDNIPIDEWSEWFLFDAVTPDLLLKFGEDFESLVNHGGFSLGPVDGFNWPLHWKNAREHEQDVFWTQIYRLKPHSYIAEGDNLIYATNDEKAFKIVKDWAMNI